MFPAVAALLVFYGAVILLAIVSGTMLRFIVPAWWLDVGSGQVALSGIVLLIGGLAVSGVLVRARWTSWPSLGWTGARRAARALLDGIGIGLATGALAMALAVVAGNARIVVTGESAAAYVGAAGPLAGALFLSALGEEVVFRGYPLVRLSRTVGKVWASVALALFFATAHLLNPEVTPLGFINIGLASLVLSAAFFTPGGLPAAWGVHFGWNGAISMADAPVSGLTFELPALEFVSRGPWIDGGSFGPEGGIAATVALGTTLLWLTERASHAEEPAP